MYIETKQRYAVNITEKEGRALLKELSQVRRENMGTQMTNLYEALGVWFGD